MQYTRLPIRYLLFILLLSLTNRQQAVAQIFGKERKTNKQSTYNRYPAKPSEKKNQDKPKKKRQLEYPSSVKKTRYRIDVLLPLYLDEMVEEGKALFKGKIPDRAQAGFSFYEGISLAVDTLNKMGYKTDVYVHDIGSKGSSLESFITTDSLRNTDLIIGFVSAQQVAPLAQYAAKLKVNFVSAFSPSDAGIRDNPYFILLNPTLQSNCEVLLQSLLKKRSKEPLIIFKRETVSVDSTAYHFMIEDPQLKDYRSLDCNKLPDSAQLASLLDSAQTNFILMPIMDANYAEKLIVAVHQYFPNYRVEWFGMPSWKSFCSNKKTIELGMGTAIYITQPYNFDALTPTAQMLAEAHKAKFDGKLNELNYRGFELLYWMTDLVNKYGSQFNEKTEDKEMAIFTRFDLKPKWDKEDKFYYLHNTHLYLFRYQAGTVLVQEH